MKSLSMDMAEKLEMVGEILEENPLFPINYIESRIGINTSSIANYIKKLAEKGDTNAQIWKKTSSMRKKWGLYAYALQIVSYAKRNEIGVEKIKKMDLYSELKTVLGVRLSRRGHSSLEGRLIKIRDYAVNLMALFGEFENLTDEQIDYMAEFYRKKLTHEKD